MESAVNKVDQIILQDTAKQLESIITLIMSTMLVCPQCKALGRITGIELNKIHYE